jgi:hypothetical protein
MNNKVVYVAAVFAILAVFSVGLYAQEQDKSSQLSFGASCTVALSDGTVSVGPGLQFSWLRPRQFNNFLGLGVHFGLLAPIGEEFGIGATLIAGPSMTVYDNGVFKIPITLGIHADFVIGIIGATSFSEIWVWNVGAGAVTDFVWQFGSKWYAYGRVQAACNFGAFEFHITPGLGMGIKR